MADNTTLNTGTGGDVIRDKDRAGVKTQIVALDLNPAGSETLMGGTMPVSGTVTANAGTGTMAVSGTVTANAGTGTMSVNSLAGTSGGSSVTKLISAASTNATSVKASAGQLDGWYLFNANAATRYLKLYNKASAPTVGTDTPVMTIPIPAGAAANVCLDPGIDFTTGIALALTTGIADSDTGAVAANDIVVNLIWK